MQTLEIVVMLALVIQVLWLWLVIDLVTQIIPSLHSGERKSPPA